jgi:hypothetical protein
MEQKKGRAIRMGFVIHFVHVNNKVLLKNIWKGKGLVINHAGGFLLKQKKTDTVYCSKGDRHSISVSSEGQS